MEELQIALVQSSIVWEDAEQNRIHFGEKIHSISSPIDIIVLPEMFTTGFSMHPRPLAEMIDGPTVNWMQLLAKQKDAVITGSVIIEDEGSYFNRMMWVTPAGDAEFYDKRHLFSLAGEDDKYSAGSEIRVVEYKGWKFCLNVCYDLRFPVWSRNTTNYDCLIYVANWPVLRVQAWSTLLRARAIENQCYVIGVNRVGEDKNQNLYNGQSVVIDMAGETVLDGGDKNEVFITELDRNNLQQFKDKFPFYRDADRFSILD